MGDSICMRLPELNSFEGKEQRLKSGLLPGGRGNWGVRWDPPALDVAWTLGFPAYISILYIKVYMIHITCKSVCLG